MRRCLLISGCIGRTSRAPWPMRRCWPDRASSARRTAKPSSTACSRSWRISRPARSSWKGRRISTPFVEQELTARIGDAGKRLHTARSRNDQVALDMRMYVKEEIKTIRALLLELIEVHLCEKASGTSDRGDAGLHASAAGPAGDAGPCVHGVWQHAAQRLCAAAEHPGADG